MAKLTTAQKIQKASDDLKIVSVKIQTYSDLRKLTDNPLILADFADSEKRAKEDVSYLENKIRGYYVREAPIAKLIQLASEMFS